MGSSSGSSRKSIMNSKGKSSYYYYAVLGICIACLPVFVAAATRHRNQRLVGARREPIRGVYKSGKFLDLQAEIKNAGFAKRTGPIQAAQSAPVPTAAVPPPAAIAPPAGPPLAAAASDASYAAYRPPPHFPKSDMTGSPSYAPRYAVPPTDPWGEQFPFEVASFRRRAQDEEETNPEDDYKPSESKRKKHAPSMFKRMSSMIRNTGSAIFGAPSYIFKRYRGSWRRFGSSGNPGGSGSSGSSGGGGKKKKGGGWKSWSTSDKNDGYGGWEELEPTGGYDHEGSQYPSEKGWNNGKGYKGSYDSNERRSDRDANGYRDREYRERDRDYRNDDYKDYDTYRNPPPSSSPSSRPRDIRDRQRNNSNSYREETHYDDYDGRRTTAYYGPARKSPPPSSKRPYVNSAGSGNGGKSGTPARYDDEY